MNTRSLLLSVAGHCLAFTIGATVFAHAQDLGSLSDADNPNALPVCDQPSDARQFAIDLIKANAVGTFNDVSAQTRSQLINQIASQDMCTHHITLPAYVDHYNNEFRVFMVVDQQDSGWIAPVLYDAYVKDGGVL